MVENLSIKDFIVLFENDLRKEKQLQDYLNSKTKEELVAHILDDLTSEDPSTDEEENGNEAELGY